MTPQVWFYVGFGLFASIVTIAGALLAFNPELFVRVLRRTAIGDYYIQSEEWKRKVVTLQGRICGFSFLCAGLYGFYLSLKVPGRV